jgi:DNA-directed RNA polymerase II subunit RPB1
MMNSTSLQLRGFVFSHSDFISSRYLPVDLQRIVQNAVQIFHIDRRKPSDLEPGYIIDAVKDLGKRLVVIRGDDLLTFWMHLRATFASRRVLEFLHNELNVQQELALRTVTADDVPQIFTSITV